MTCDKWSQRSDDKGGKVGEVFKRTFLHVHSTVGAFEATGYLHRHGPMVHGFTVMVMRQAEEVGVEHLLRDIKNA